MLLPLYNGEKNASIGGEMSPPAQRLIPADTREAGKIKGFQGRERRLVGRGYSGEDTYVLKFI